MVVSADAVFVSCNLPLLNSARYSSGCTCKDLENFLVAGGIWKIFSSRLGAPTVQEHPLTSSSIRG